MNVLQFHTRDNASPHGKASVYFTAHPEDADTFLPDIERDILHIQDCVFWFDSDADRKIDDDFLTELSFMKMQLMVIPVTKKLLTEDNRVTQSELDFARKHHIPVLPIVVENGLEHIYKKIFGDLQYLNRISKDPTAIPYEEKLAKHLNSVLVQDETVARIQNNFDAKIFLSYRKKDRELAQKLMKHIHRAPPLQGVGIWYDEFLVPGEGFNDGIRTAIEKSHLFVLTVTPNLVNEDNYIRENEYKWARKDYDKKVLPAQMEYTERALLDDCFWDFPAVIDANCDEVLHPALLDALQDRLTARHRDPGQKYLLGLAYLHGVEMETNQDLGTKLILEAANDGLLEAKEKMVQMHFYGHGVDQDYNKAIVWQQAVVDDYEKLYHQDPTEENWYRYIRELIFLGDDLVQMCRWDEAIAVYETAQRLFRTQLGNQENIQYRERFIYVLRELSIAHSRNDDLDAAISTMNTALREIEFVAEADVSLQLRWYHAQALCDLGAMYQSAGRSDQALPHCNAALKRVDALYDEDSSNSVLLLWARIYYYLAHLHEDYHTWNEEKQRYEADICYARCLKLLSFIEKSMPTANEISFLGESLRAAGEYFERRDEFTIAEQFYTQSLTRFDSLQEECPTEHFEEMRERTLCSLEALQISQNRHPDQRRRPQFVKEADDRAEKNPSKKNIRARANAHRELAKARSRAGDFERADTAFRKAISLYQSLWLEDKQPADACALCMTTMDMVESMRKAGLWNQMPSHLAQVKDIALEALQHKDSPELRRELARAYTYLGHYYQNLDGQFSLAALDRYLDALPLWEQLSQETNHLHMRLFRIECKAEIAYCYLTAQGDTHISQACEYSREALEEILQFAQHTMPSDMAMCLQKCHQSRAMALFFNQQKKDALPHFTQAYELLEKVKDKYDAVDYDFKRAQMLYFMGELTPGPQGLRHLKNAKAMMETLYQKHPTSQYKRALGMILLALQKN